MGCLTVVPGLGHHALAADFPVYVIISVALPVVLDALGTVSIFSRGKSLT